MDRRKTDRRNSVTGDMNVLDIQALFGILWKRKTFLIVIFILLMIPGVLYVLLRNDEYKATASVLLENQQLNLTDFQDVLPSRELNDMTIGTQTKVIASPTLARKTIDSLNAQAKEGDKAAQHETLVGFLKGLSVSQQAKTRVIDISYKARDPFEAAKIANAHAQSYVDYQIESKKEQIQTINEWISTQVANLKKDSQSKSQAIQDFRKEAGIVLGKNSQELIFQQISDLTAQLVPVETEKLNLQARVDALASVKSQDAMADVIGSSLISNLKAEASRAKQELQAINGDLGKNHPSLIAAQRRVAQANADIGREISNVKNSLKLQLEAATNQEQLLRTRLEELNRQSDELREKEITLEGLQAEEAANKVLLESFTKRYEEIKSQLDYNRGDVSIVAQAEVPTQPIGSPKPVLLALVAIFSALVATGIVFALELVDRGIEDAEDVKRSLNLRLLGVLPKTRNALAEIGGNKRSPYLEELKRIYLQLSANKSPQIVLMTAAQNHEGVSTTAMAFGRYVSSIGAKTVVIDTNTSNPSIAAMAQVAETPGFADIMAGAIETAKAIYREESGLNVIPAGNVRSHGVDLVAGGALQKILEQLKTQYDYIIIDCAPTLQTTDSEIIAGYADKVIMIVEWAKTPQKKLKKIAEILRQFSKETPYAILNKHP